MRCGICSRLNLLLKKIHPCLLFLMGTLFLGAFFFFQKGMTLLPLYGIGDSTLWEFQQHFFSKNLFWNGTFFDLNLNSQDVIYPYHVNGVFQPWSLEREFLGTFFLKFFPTLSFLNLYFIVSLIISSIVSFAILRRSAAKDGVTHKHKIIEAIS